jgi:hypothetical protein
MLIELARARQSTFIMASIPSTADTCERTPKSMGEFEGSKGWVGKS